MENVNRSSQFESRVRYNWEWPIGVGSLLIIFGILAIIAPVVSTLGVTWIIGGLLLATGIMQLVHAFSFVKEPGNTTRYLLAALSIVAGVLIMRHPVVGALGITAALTFYFLVNAVAKAILATETYPMKGWGFVLVSASFSLVLGIVLLISFPTVSLIVPGVLFGADLIVYGGALIGFSLALRKAARHEITEVRKAA